MVRSCNLYDYSLHFTLSQAVIGGFAAQEAVKACSSKFKPLNQWYHLDASNCLPSPDQMASITETMVKDQGTRYDSQISIFGHDFQKRLNDLNLFMVGRRIFSRQ